jgi:hypothetical protein
MHLRQRVALCRARRLFIGGHAGDGVQLRLDLCDQGLGKHKLAILDLFHLLRLAVQELLQLPDVLLVHLLLL